MANFQAFKLLCITMLLLGLSINDKVKVSFAANLEGDDARRAAFNKILISGFLQFIDDNEKLFDDYTLTFFLAYFDETIPKSFGEYDTYFNKEEKAIRWRKFCIQKLKEKIESNKTVKVEEFELNVKIEREILKSDNSSATSEKIIVLKLESIQFNEIAFKKQIIIGDQGYDQYMPNMEMLHDLNEKLNFEETYNLSDEAIKKIENSVSISLVIKSVHNITPVFNQSKLLKV